MISFVQSGGLLMIPLFILSVIMIAVAIDRIYTITKTNRDLNKFIPQFWEVINTHGKTKGQEFANSWKIPLSRIFSDTISLSQYNGTTIQDTIRKKSDLYTSFLRKRTEVLNLITYASPLLGLLGTVIGMIICFRNLESSNALGAERMSTLSGGIWQALITTACGLSISIVSYFLYHYICSLSNKILDKIEREVELLIHKLKTANNELSRSFGQPGRQPTAIRSRTTAKRTIQHATNA